MVDRLTVYPNAWGPFRGGSCHLTSTSIDVLHRFALRLGLRREWFQDHRVAAHYDLTKGKRRKAIELGGRDRSSDAHADPPIPLAIQDLSLGSARAFVRRMHSASS